MTAPESAHDAFTRVAALDRSAHERVDPELLDRLRADERTRVLLVAADAAPLSAGGGLAWVAPGEVPATAEVAFLGRAADGAGMLVAAVGDDETAGGEGWATLRTVGADLPEGDAAAFVTAVALGRWLRDAAYCPACGSRTHLRSAGWSRSCPACGREHFPRTDPAVIVAVTHADDPDVLLLGSNALWDANRYSCFAGFAEAGESLEDAVVREVNEEAGVAVAELRYLGSQGWPYPRSLMLGFEAVAASGAQARPDGEEILDVRWFTRAEIGEALAGGSELKLPGPASIAYRLIRRWHEATP